MTLIPLRHPAEARNVLEIRSGALWFVSKLGDLGQKWPRPPPGNPMTAGFGASGFGSWSSRTMQDVHSKLEAIPKARELGIIE